MPREQRWFSYRLEHALRRAAQWHDGQYRKASRVPYVEHPFAVALILERSGFEEPVVIAGLLHDTIEDTGATFEQIVREFGREVAELVRYVSERKQDDEGRPIAWAVRKRAHREHLATGPAEARAIALADKLHNLTTMVCDLETETPLTFWSRFNASRAEIMREQAALIDAVGVGDARLEELAAACRELLADLGAGQSTVE